MAIVFCSEEAAICTAVPSRARAFDGVQNYRFTIRIEKPLRAWSLGTRLKRNGKVGKCVKVQLRCTKQKLM